MEKGRDGGRGGIERMGGRGREGEGGRPRDQVQEQQARIKTHPSGGVGHPAVMTRYHSPALVPLITSPSLTLTHSWPPCRSRNPSRETSHLLTSFPLSHSDSL